MPELPDVQGLKQYIDATSLRQVVCDVSVQDSRIVKDVTVLTLREHLENPERQSTTRHGKYLSASHSSRGNLVLHFRMTENLLHHSYPGRTRAHAVCPHFRQWKSALAYQRATIGKSELLQGPTAVHTRAPPLN
jgi:formamidopyrimidine-DNA glycosylase